MGASVNFTPLPTHKTATALLYGMQNAVVTNTRHSCTDWLQIDLWNFAFSPLKVSENSGGAYWPRGGAKVRLAPP